MSEVPTITLRDAPQGFADCPGFRTAATACDIRENGAVRNDLAVISADGPLEAAGVFTKNDICAAPVQLCREQLSAAAGKVAGCVVNSGNANACTGAQGMCDAREMAALTQKALGAEAPVLVCSTGRIGRQLPMPTIRKGIRKASEQVNASAENAVAAADAILTSDTRRKLATVQIKWHGQTFTVAGMAKGAGMIEPNMATMLAFLGTDLEIPASELKPILTHAVEQTFNRISIDGDMSTNDTVLLFANGHSGTRLGAAGSTLYVAFAQAVEQVCAVLADKIVGDGEKITKVIELTVKGAPTAAAAEKVARAIGNSLLVKTSWYGSDPNWGRLVDAAGYARIGLVEEKLDLHYNDTAALLQGVPQDALIPEWRKIVAEKRFRISLNLNLGSAEYRILTTDLSEAYVNFNKSE